MDILDEVKNDFTKAKILKFLQAYSYHLITIFALTVTCIILIIYWGNYKKKILLASGNKYNVIVDYNHPNTIANLEELKKVKNIYGGLSTLRLAEYYLKLKNFYQAINTYQLIIESKNSIKVYKDYAQLMIIKVRLITSTISNKKALQIYQDYYDDNTYLKTITILGSSIVGINSYETKTTEINLNKLLTCNEIAISSLFFAKVVKKNICYN